MLAELAARLDAQSARPILRVAVDGVDGAGKTTFADELAAVLRRRGREVIRASADGFHNPRAVRYRLGRDSPEGFYRDSYDYVALRRALLDPLGPDGPLRYRTAVFDVDADQSVSQSEVTARPGSILIVDGLFLHRPELCGVWDDSVFLRVDFGVSVPRGAARGLGFGSPDPAAESNRRYIGGNALYVREADPENWAGVVVDNNDLNAPFRVSDALIQTPIESFVKTMEIRAKREGAGRVPGVELANRCPPGLSTKQTESVSDAEAQTAEAQSVLGPTARILAAGATCEVYTDGERVLRLAHGPEARLSSQAAVMRALHAAGVPTPEVLDVGLLPSGRAFSLERMVPGDDAGPSREGWGDLGRALEVLHTLPHAGFGLLKDWGGDFRGVATTPAGGLRTRLRSWPFSPGKLRDQPLIHHAPHLAAPLAALEPELWQVAETPSALCHTDLHAGQFRWMGGRLVALLDFGDAAVGPPVWDVASVAYFHGWDVAELVAEMASLRCDRHAALFGVLLAFHRACRAAEQGRPQCSAEAVAFARGCLDRLG